MSLHNPFDAGARLRPGCSCGQHATQADHELDDEQGLNRRVIQSTVMRALFPDDAERRRFLRHLRPWWDVHRHRIAPAVGAALDRIERNGRLVFAAGRIMSAAPARGGAVLHWRPRGGDRIETVAAARIVNCTGPELDIARAGEPLLDALLAAGRIRPDPYRLGIDVDEHCRVLDRDGTPSDRLFTLGAMTRGAFWESIAAGDIAAQAQAIARRLAG